MTQPAPPLTFKGLPREILDLGCVTMGLTFSLEEERLHATNGVASANFYTERSPTLSIDGARCGWIGWIETWVSVDRRDGWLVRFEGACNLNPCYTSQSSGHTVYSGFVPHLHSAPHHSLHPGFIPRPPKQRYKDLAATHPLLPTPWFQHLSPHSHPPLQTRLLGIQMQCTTWWQTSSGRVVRRGLAPV